MWDQLWDHLACSPAARLVAAGIANRRSSSAFLWGDALHCAPVGTGIEGSLYMQRLHQTPRPFVHARRCLSSHETASLIGGLSGQPQHAALDLGIENDANHLIRPPFFSVLSECARNIGSDLCRASQHNTEHQSSAAAELPFDVCDMDKSAIGSELIEELKQGLKAYWQTSGGGAHVSDEELRCHAHSMSTRLKALLQLAGDTQRRLLERLLSSLRQGPPGAAGAVMAVLRASGHIAEPAATDLVMLPVDRTLIKVCFPTCRRLIVSIADCLRLTSAPCQGSVLSTRATYALKHWWRALMHAMFDGELLSTSATFSHACHI
jgi:hypothetical protein